MNIFSKIGGGIGDAAKWLAHAVALTVGTAKRVEYVLSSAMPLEKPFVSALGTLVGDVETLTAEAQVAVTDGGLNFPVDSSGYQTFLRIVADFKTLAPLVEDAVALLEGKPEPDPLPAAPAAGVTTATANSSPALNADGLPVLA